MTFSTPSVENHVVSWRLLVHHAIGHSTDGSAGNRTRQRRTRLPPSSNSPLRFLL